MGLFDRWPLDKNGGIDYENQLFIKTGPVIKLVIATSTGKVAAAALYAKVEGASANTLSVLKQRTPLRAAL